MPQTRNVDESTIAMSEMIGKSPGWLLRSGITMVAIVTSSIIAMSYFISYPDKLIGTGVLTSDQPPIELWSNSAGYIEQIILPADSIVEKGDPIIYIQSAVHKEDVHVLREWVADYKNSDQLKEVLRLDLPDNLQLGSVQSQYATLEMQYRDYQRLLRQNIVFQQIDNIAREIARTQELNQTQKKECDLYQQELQLVDKDHQRNTLLAQDKIISELDLEKSQQQLLSAQRQYESMSKSILQNKIRIQQLKQQQLILKDERAKQIAQAQINILQTIQNIEAGIYNWDRSSITRAGVSGRISLLPEVALQRNVQMKQLLGYIIPGVEDNKYVIANMPMAQSGKLEVGQRAYIKFPAYPHKEYGMLRSQVSNIDAIPRRNESGEEYYQVKIPLTNPMMTDYDKGIPYQPNMELSVEVVTERRSVFERIFDQFISLIDEK